MDKSVYGIISFLLVLGSTVPYVFDILKGRVKLSRSTRRLFLILVVANAYIQASSFTSWVLALVFADIITQIVLFGLSFKFGIGGGDRLDKWCYFFFALAFGGYIFFKNPIVSLLLLAVADLVGFLPTIVKNWSDPSSDTWRFYLIGGVIAPIFSLLAAENHGAVELLFPYYIIIVNTAAMIPLFSKKRY